MAGGGGQGTGGQGRDIALPSRKERDATVRPKAEPCRYRHQDRDPERPLPREGGRASMTGRTRPINGPLRGARGAGRTAPQSTRRSLHYRGDRHRLPFYPRGQALRHRSGPAWPEVVNRNGSAAFRGIADGGKVTFARTRAQSGIPASGPARGAAMSGVAIRCGSNHRRGAGGKILFPICAFACGPEPLVVRTGLTT